MVISQTQNQLKQLRLSRNLSQKQLADRIGTSRFSIGRWERHITIPPPTFITRLCDFFQLTPEKLGFPQLSSQHTTLNYPLSRPDTATLLRSALPQTIPEGIYDPAIPLSAPNYLVGRETEIATLKQRLFTGGNAALTALSGLPGVGKTALAIQLAHDPEVREHFTDGILWAALGPQPDIPGVLSRWGTLLGISSAQMTALTTNEEWAKAIRRTIGSRKMLLIIDDAWQVEAALTFKTGGPECAHLITTRLPTIATHLTTDGVLVLPELNEAHSLQLLSHLAPQIILQEEEKSLALIRAVGGLPLALTLIGHSLRSQSNDDKTDHVPTTFWSTSLTTNLHHSLEGVIAVTDQKLPAHVRSTLYTLSIFPAKPHSFSEEAALTIANCSYEILDALIDTGLLECSSSDRYTLHQTIADYARPKLMDTTGIVRFIQYYLTYVEEHKRDYELLEMERTTILAALEQASTQNMWAEYIRIVLAFTPFLRLRGLYTQALNYLALAHTAAQRLNDHYGIMNTLLYQGEIALKQSDYGRAKEILPQALKIARDLEDRECISAILAASGTASWKRGEYPQAEAELQEGLTLARQIGDSERICNLLLTLGSAFGSRSIHHQAEIYIQEGLELAYTIGNREQICNLLMNLGVTLAAQEKRERAEHYFLESLKLARQIGYRELICALLANLGSLQEDYQKAEAYFREGVELAQTLHHREWMSALLINSAIIARKQQRYTEAEQFIQESVHLAQQLQRPQLSAHALYEHGNISLAQDQLTTAQDIFQQMLAIMPAGCLDLEALAHYGLARIAASRGDIAQAKQLGQTSQTTLETLHHRYTKEVQEWLQSLP
ncbi:tetratricopeptide repeat protein [Tengunoibacter tsumagoiensis]|uniref:HTH cro/C1-type domain-containing protein n=1 Tax=Tengunoibacter tsumagoiensis TaxID=2014871 RepID=A0A402A6B7_9CHLR|nr:tetratricopeptide repeat protein [Tengunoibacter tsumagoiensis]GCE14683.1 hypothetical protein KTT_45420 [Tengunoibacter tsumagoiensis]